jgi:hypothetical protein
MGALVTFPLVPPFPGVVGWATAPLAAAAINRAGRASRRIGAYRIEFPHNSSSCSATMACLDVPGNPEFAYGTRRQMGGTVAASGCFCVAIRAGTPVSI